MTAGEAKAALRLIPGGLSAPVDPTAPRSSTSSVPPAPGQPPRVGLPSGGKWARYAGKLGAALTVTVSAASIRKGGHEPNEPDDADVELLQEALEEGLRLRFGEHDVPWWLGAGLAAGGVYAGMRIGAAKMEKPDGPTVDQQGAIVPDAPNPKPTQTQQSRLAGVILQPQGT